MICVPVWFVLTARLYRLLRTRHPDVYDSLGRPTLIFSNNIRNGWLVTQFLLGGHFEGIEDSEILRLFNSCGFSQFAISRFSSASLSLGSFSLCPIHHVDVSATSNQPMKPTAPDRVNASDLATAPWISPRCPASLVRFASSCSRTPAVKLFNAPTARCYR